MTRQLQRSQGFHGQGGELVQCSVEGCQHIGEVITAAHCRIVHEMTREEVEKKFGKPYRIIIKKGSLLNVE